MTYTVTLFRALTEKLFNQQKERHNTLGQQKVGVAHGK